MLDEYQFLVSEVAFRLSKFKRKKRNLFNFRCVICGDSKYDPNKARAYIYESKGTLKYKCHNCGVNLSFKQFLWQFDNNLYKQYLYYKFGEKTKTNKEPDYNYDVAEKIEKVSDTKSYFKYLEGPLTELEENHIAIKFVTERKIPKEYWQELYFTNNYKRFINNIAIENQFKIENGGSRLIIPFYDEEGDLIALQGRALENQNIKYLTHKIAEDNPKIFGLNEINKNQRVYIVEGPIDSMFIDNSIAAAGSDLKSISLKDYVFIFDNEPRNKEQINKIDKAIDNEHPVYIPPTWLHEKDINDLIISGYSKQKIRELIDSNTYKNSLKARLAFNHWKKI